MKPVNDAPTVADFLVNGTEDEAFSFSQFHFSQSFHDVDDDDLEKIKITKLPKHGILLLEGSPVF